MEKETRTFKTTYKRDEEGRMVSGLAAVYNSRTDLGYFEEEIAPGAFDDAIDVSDARALFNHDPNHLLARQGSGTLTIRDGADGLGYEFEMPTTTLGNDLLVLMERGDLNQSSFAFTIAEGGQEWRTEKRGDKEVDVRRITKVSRLYDVSPVTYPAYQDTTVGKRAWEARCAEKEAERKEEVRAESGEFDKREARLREVRLLTIND